ncbi:MAG: flagellar basal body-associated FliL family protein [Candidatus Zixiibacteriota bacterium]
MPIDDRLNPDDTALADGEDQVGQSRKKKPWLIYLVVVAVMAAGGYFIGTKFLKSSEPVSTEEKSDEKKDDEKKNNAATEMFMMEDIIVNPSGTGGTRFLSVSIGFELGSREAVLQFEKREPVIKDALITILGSKTIEQLSDSREKEITRYQIKKRVEQLMQTKELSAVYFTDFILQ